MADEDEYCAAAVRVMDAWAAGRRARDWSYEDLTEALRLHREQWQEAWIRLMLAYHYFDCGRKRDALPQLLYANRMAQVLWEEDEPFRWRISLELAFVAARCGRPHEQTNEWLEAAHAHAGADPYLPYMMTMVAAAQGVALKDPKAIDHIEVAARWIASEPDPEAENNQAELDWIQDMRNDFYAGRIE